MIKKSRLSQLHTFGCRNFEDKFKLYYKVNFFCSEIKHTTVLSMKTWVKFFQVRFTLVLAIKKPDTMLTLVAV